MFRRRRFADLIERQLDLFERENADALRRVAETRRRELRADEEDATEAFGDYLDEVGWAAEELRDIRDGYAGTLDAAATSAYFGAYGKAVRRRYPELYDAYRHDEDLAGGVEDDD